MNHKEKTLGRLEKLKGLLSGQSQVLIVMQDNPDPDSIAAAVALRELVHHFAGINCSITHGGTVGRAENRALVRYLCLNLRPFHEIDVSKFSIIAMVDTQPGTGNNPLPDSIVPDIVIDHHPYRRATAKSELIDVRKNYGATSTILYEYLFHAGITPEPPLATAIIYAIRSDTQDLGMDATRADIDTIHELFPLANKRMLSQIQRGQVQREYYQMLSDGLRNARIWGKCVVTGLGEIDVPDMIGEVADLLLRDDEVTWAMCYGIYEGKMLLSLRSSEAGCNAGEVIHKLVARRGTGGGHAVMGGGQVPLKKRKGDQILELERILIQKLLKLLGVTQVDPIRLTKCRETRCSYVHPKILP